MVTFPSRKIVNFAGLIVCLLALAGVAHAQLDDQAVAHGDAFIKIIPTLSAKSVKNGEHLKISVLVKAPAGVNRVEAEIEGNDRIELKPGGPDVSVGLYEANWTAHGLREQAYRVTVRVTDLAGHVLTDQSLSFTDPIAGNTTVGISPTNGGTQHAGTVRLDSKEEQLYCAVVDQAAGFAYFAVRGIGKIIKVRLSDFTRVGSIMLDAGEDYIRCGVIDSTAGYAYFGLGMTPGKIVKVRLSDFKRVDALTLGAADKNLISAAIDPAGGYAYFGTETYPGRVVKIRLSDFSCVATMVFETGEALVSCALADPAAGYVYFATQLNPGRIIRVRLSDFTRDGTITLQSGEDKISCATIDTVHGYAYFGTGSGQPYIIKIRLSDFSRAGALALNSDEYGLTTALVDPAGDYAYFSASIKVMKIRLSDFTRESGLTFNANNYWTASAVIHPATGSIYYGTASTPGNVIKLRLSDFSQAAVLTLYPGENNVKCGVVDETNGYAYFGTDTEPGMIVKIRLSDVSRVDSMILPADEKNLSAAAIDPAGGFAYFATSTYPAKIIKIKLSDFTRVTALTTWQSNISCAGIDTAHGYVYFGTHTQPGAITKINLSTFLVEKTLGLPAYENYIGSMVIDSAGGYGYFGMKLIPGRIVKVRLSDLTRVGALDLNEGEYAVDCGVLDPVHNCMYWGANELAIKVGLVDFKRESTLALKDFSALKTVVIDPGAGSAYFIANNSVASILKVRLSDFTLAGKTQVPGSNHWPLSAVVDTRRDYFYITISGAPSSIVKFNFSYRDTILANKVAVPDYALINSVSFYSHAASGKVRLGIYSDTSPKVLLWESNPVSNTVANGWLTLPISSGTPSGLKLAPGNYWLAWQCDSTQNVASYAYSTVNQLGMNYAFNAYPAALNDASTLQTHELWSEYLTYTVTRNAARDWCAYE